MPDNINYDDYDTDVSLDPEDKAKVGTGNQEWFRMVKGQTALCSFLYYHSYDLMAVKAFRRAKKGATPDEIKAVVAKTLEERAKALGKSVDQLTPEDKLNLSQVQFRSCNAHYQQGLGYVLTGLGRDGPEADAVWKKLPEAKTYFTTVLLIYPMTPEGKHDIEGIKKGSWRILPWRFGRNTYEEIWNLNDGLRGNQMTIATQDIRLECKDTTYQNMKVSFVGKAVWQSNVAFRNMILSKAIPLYDKLVPFRTLTTDALRAKLGMATSGVQDVSVGEDFSGILDSV
jgi:hypothetical protein